MDILSEIKRLRRRLCCCKNNRCVTLVTGQYNTLAPIESDNIPSNCSLETIIYVGGIQLGVTVVSSQGDLMSNYISQLNIAFVSIATFTFDEPTQTITATFPVCSNYTMLCTATCDR